MWVRSSDRKGWFWSHSANIMPYFQVDNLVYTYPNRGLHHILRHQHRATINNICTSMCWRDHRHRIHRTLWILNMFLVWKCICTKCALQLAKCGFTSIRIIFGQKPFRIQGKGLWAPGMARASQVIHGWLFYIMTWIWVLH